jgi:hypothetical protein
MTRAPVDAGRDMELYILEGAVAWLAEQRCSAVLCRVGNGPLRRQPRHCRNQPEGDTGRCWQHQDDASAEEE